MSLVVFLDSYAGCVIYPAYKSVLAIESPDRADDTQWLTYWVVFSVVGFVETVSDLLLDWIPFYFFVKCGFFYYLMNPRLKVRVFKPLSLSSNPNLVYFDLILQLYIFYVRGQPVCTKYFCSPSPRNTSGEARFQLMLSNCVCTVRSFEIYLSE
jgi:hypothetical protein